MADASPRKIFPDDQDAAGARYGGDNGIHVQRAHRPKIHDLHFIAAFLLKQVRRAHGFRHQIVFNHMGLLGVSGNYAVEFDILAACFTAMAIWRHRANIKRLLSGTENKFGQKAK